MSLFPVKNNIVNIALLLIKELLVLGKVGEWVVLYKHYNIFTQ